VTYLVTEPSKPQSPNNTTKNWSIASIAINEMLKSPPQLGLRSLWLERSDRVRIHAMVRDYEVDGIPTHPIQTCEICTKKEHRAADETPKPEAVDEKQVRSDEPKHEYREHRGRRSGGGNRSTVRSTKRSLNLPFDSVYGGQAQSQTYLLARKRMVVAYREE
jgi:hypothetical protein